MFPFIANTDKDWFDFLSSSAVNGVVDEVNFWQPRAQTLMKAMEPGEPVFFRLKQPDHAIGGYGFFARFELLPVALAWNIFGWKNGDNSPTSFERRIAGYRRGGGPEHLDPGRRLGCTVLRDARFWRDDRWIPWREPQGWARNIVQGKTESMPTRAALLLGCIERDAAAVPGDLRPEFSLVDVDGRTVRSRPVADRQGQGLFRLRLLDAYGQRCAISGERTEPVLDAAHIQSYLGPSSNHVQNGLLLTKEWHALYDRGLVTVTPDYVVRVSPRIRQVWSNGKRYYGHHGTGLRLPEVAANRPSRDALAWHAEQWFDAG